MRFSTLLMSGTVLALTLSLTSTGFAEDIDFGDDTSAFANDGQCDDPRFIGEGAASFSTAVDTLRDATDCKTLFDAEKITLKPVEESATAEIAAPSNTTDSEVDFGDDEGDWANDGECDDPRFGGMLDDHRKHDATDCRIGVENGDVEYIGEGRQPVPFTITDLDFGKDTGTYANDGECDDPRFGGYLFSHLKADATDCRAAIKSGSAEYFGEGLFEGERADISTINFGNNDGEFANDGECDDPRFSGPMVSNSMRHMIAKDANDCRAVFEAGYINFTGEIEVAEYPIIVDGITFGYDGGDFAFDGECDDPRFAPSSELDSHLEQDATDCSQLYNEGNLTLKNIEADSDIVINFGDDSGSVANNGVCDDPRFQGSGAAPELRRSNILKDASDCREAYNAGTVKYMPN